MNVRPTLVLGRVSEPTPCSCSTSNGKCCRARTTRVYVWPDGTVSPDCGRHGTVEDRMAGTR